MVVIIFLGLIVLSQQIVANDCDSRCYCKEFRLSHHLVPITEKQREDNTIWDDCINDIKDYFNSTSEPKKSVFEYAQACRKIGIDHKECAKEIKLLKKLNYNMESAASLLIHIGAEAYEEMQKSNKKINLKSEHWSYMKNMENLRIVKCLDEFSGDDKTYNNAENLIHKYYKWTDEDEYRLPGFCNCIFVFGIQRIYQINVNNGERYTLKDYFSHLCLNPFPKCTLWTKEHFYALANYKNGIGPPTLNVFLRNAPILIEAGWAGRKLQEYPFEKLKKDIDLGWDTVSTLGIYKAVLTIKYDNVFTLDQSERLLQISFGETFFDEKCHKHTVINVFFETKKFNNDLLCEKNYKFYQRNNRDIFIEHLKLLVDISKNNPKTHTCSKFVEYLNDYKTTFYQTTWSPSSMTEILEASLKDKKDMESLLNCLKFSHTVEEAISEKDLLKNSKNVSIQYANQFHQFRKRLFNKSEEDMKQICTNTHGEYNTEKNNDILQLIGIIFDQETKIVDLQKLFDSLK